MPCTASIQPATTRYGNWKLQSVASQNAKMPLFAMAAKTWIESRSGLAEHTVVSYGHYVKALVDHFGSRLVCDIAGGDIASLQAARLPAGRSQRLLNYKVGTLRQILKAYGFWATVTGQIRFLREGHDVGRAIFT